MGSTRSPPLDFDFYDHVHLNVHEQFDHEHVKVVKIPGFPGFFSDICPKFQVFSGFFQNFSNSTFFSLNCQIPGFSKFPGFLATLMHETNKMCL